MANINLDELLAQRREATGADGDRIPFDFKGETYSFLDPLLLDDEQNEELSEMEWGPDIAAFYMGEEQYEKFLDNGGTANLFFLAFSQYTQESRDELQGKSTRGNRSSRRMARRPKR